MTCFSLTRRAPLSPLLMALCLLNQSLLPTPSLPPPPPPQSSRTRLLWTLLCPPRGQESPEEEEEEEGEEKEEEEEEEKEEEEEGYQLGGVCDLLMVCRQPMSWLVWELWFLQFNTLPEWWIRYNRTSRY